jgi:hypothetical protein
MNQTLREELLSMEEEDQRVRRELIERGELFKGYHPEMEALHERNNRRLAEIIEAQGWPTKTLVGEDGARAAWLVLQHAISMPSLMRRCLTLLQQAARDGEANAAHVAYLEDRICVFEGRPQRYGTQFDWNEAGEMAPSPIDEPETINERRAALGLGTMEENIQRMRASMQGESPPADLEKRRAEVSQWKKKVGWS